MAVIKETDRNYLSYTASWSYSMPLKETTNSNPQHTASKLAQVLLGQGIIASTEVEY